jgi:tetratricopeptide (TPR) repeat protein
MDAIIRGVDEIDQLRSALHRDPQRVAQRASEIVAAGGTEGDPATLSRALAVLGRARRALGDIELAESDLDRAISVAMRCGGGDLAADAHLGIAGVLSLAGRPAEAFGHLDSAHELGGARIRGYVALQRAIIQQRIGLMEQALASYEAALPLLRATDSRVDIAMVLVNRGVIRIQAGECDAAVEDLSEAQRLYQSEQQPFGVARTLHGLGWAHARRGELPSALRYLDQAAEQFQRLGSPALDVEVDRVEVLLAAGLFGQAGEEAVTVANRLYGSGNHSLAAEAWLLCGRAAVLDGDREVGAAYARRARDMFAAQGSPGWERAARLECHLAEAGGGDVAELRTLADDLGRSGNARGAATALALAAIAACERGEIPAAGTLSTECTRAARRLGIFDVRMLARYARARHLLAQGNEAAATRQVRAGLADLRLHRASWAASDARAGVAVHAGRLAALGLRMALRHGSAASVLEWMELVRAERANPRPARPPEDGALAAELTELRGVVSLVRKGEADGTDVIDLLRAQRDLERRIHRRQLRTAASESTGSEPAVTAPRLRAVLRGRTLVELTVVEGRLIGVGVDARRCRLADLGPVAESESAVATVMSTVRHLAAPASSNKDRQTSLELLRRAARKLDDTLGTLMAGEGPVVLVVPAGLHTLPWQLLPRLAARPVVVAPSATWWHNVETADATARAGGAVAVAGPRLAEAEREAAKVAGCHPGSTLLVGAAATAQGVLSALESASLAHIACHGRIRYDNPLWSSLELADGPLCVYDLERLDRTPPLVVLSGCDTGVGVRAGDELLGLATALLARGTRSLVASVCSLPDSAGLRDTMTAFHEKLAAGTPPATALAELSNGAPGDLVSLLAAVLTCFGTTE